MVPPGGEKKSLRKCKLSFARSLDLIHFASVQVQRTPNVAPICERGRASRVQQQIMRLLLPPVRSSKQELEFNDYEVSHRNHSPSLLLQPTPYSREIRDVAFAEEICQCAFFWNYLKAIDIPDKEDK